MNDFHSVLAKVLLAEDNLNSGDINYREISVRKPEKYVLSRACINISGEIADLNDPNNYGNPWLRLTSGIYSIRYDNYYTRRKVPHGKKYVPDKPFKIVQDLTSKNIALSGPKMWKEVCKLIPDYDFLDKYCTVNFDTLFEIARSCPGVPLPFTLDYEKLAKQGRAKYVKYIDKKDYKTLYLQGAPIEAPSNWLELSQQSEEVKAELKANIKEHARLAEKYKDKEKWANE